MSDILIVIKAYHRFNYLIKICLYRFLKSSAYVFLDESAISAQSRITREAAPDHHHNHREPEHHHHREPEHHHHHNGDGGYGGNRGGYGGSSGFSGSGAEAGSFSGGSGHRGQGSGFSGTGAQAGSFSGGNRGQGGGSSNAQSESFQFNTPLGQFSGSESIASSNSGNRGGNRGRY